MIYFLARTIYKYFKKFVKFEFLNLKNYIYLVIFKIIIIWYIIYIKNNFKDSNTILFVLNV